jgi:hypothetical protein
LGFVLAPVAEAAARAGTPALAEDALAGDTLVAAALAGVGLRVARAGLRAASAWRDAAGWRVRVAGLSDGWGPVVLRRAMAAA